MLLGITINVLKLARYLGLVIPISLSFLATALQQPQPMPDFTLPSAFNDYAQRLAEQRGRPVMILILKRCDSCAEQLLGFQALAQKYADAGLVSWVIWTPYKDDVPPRLGLTTLKNNNSLALSVERPAVYLVNRDGSLDYQLAGSYKELERQLTSLMEPWLNGATQHTQE